MIERVLETGTVINVGLGGYLQLANAEKREGKWYIKGEPLNPARQYVLALPQFVMGGGEANLEFLKNYEDTARNPEAFGQVKNDVRDIIMAYLKQQSNEAG